LRIAFLGNDPWSAPTLAALHDADGIDVALVVTNPPKPAGRGSRLRPTSVAIEAQRLGAPLMEADGVRSGPGFDALAPLRPDLIVVVAYGELLSRAVLALPRLGCINVHLSLLPRWRGAAPVQRAILAGDLHSGVSVMQMDEGLDTGPVFASVREPIGPEDDAGTLGGRLATIGAATAVDVVHALGAGDVEARPQDESGALYAAKIGREERVIDWSASADAVARTVRALAPDPGATTSFRDHALKILKVRERSEEGAPGRIVSTEEGPLIGTGTRAIELLELAPSGRRRMSGADWARGARIGADERFG
jgi:methionyl-tRNA formyltransferase